VGVIIANDVRGFEVERTKQAAPVNSSREFGLPVLRFSKLGSYIYI